jgi:hypothetical protein
MAQWTFHTQNVAFLCRLHHNERSALSKTAPKMPLGPMRKVQLWYGAMNFIPALAVHSRIADSYTRWRGIFKGLSQEGGRADFFKKISAPLSLIKAFWMNLISAGSISLDSIVLLISWKLLCLCFQKLTIYKIAANFRPLAERGLDKFSLCAPD